MLIAILGAAGKTGATLTAEALRRGHSVIAMARTPERIALVDVHLTKRRADALDGESVVAGLAGADAVITSIGALDLSDKHDKLSTTGHRHVLDGMQAHGIRRLVVISSLGALQGVKRKGLLRRLFNHLRRRYYADIRQMEIVVLAEPGISSTVVREARRWACRETLRTATRPARAITKASRPRSSLPAGLSVMCVVCTPAPIITASRPNGGGPVRKPALRSLIAAT
jgi:uncharacterized protein YbjT (DUF2867 family)